MEITEVLFVFLSQFPQLSRGSVPFIIGKPFLKQKRHLKQSQRKMKNAAQFTSFKRPEPKMCPSPEISEPVKKKDSLCEEGGVKSKEL